MIIFGSKMYGVRNVVRGFGECEHCECYAQHKSYSGRKWGHVYFIPLFPMGGRVRVLRECSNCDTGAHIPEDELPDMIDAIRNALEACISTLDLHTHECNHPEIDEPVPIGPYIRETVGTLYLLESESLIDEARQAFDGKAAAYESNITQAALAEVKGDDDQALEHYSNARQIAAEFPTFVMAGICQRNEHHEKALSLYNQLLSTVDEPLQVLLAMTESLESLKSHDELCDVLEKCIALEPGLAENKKFMKYCKKVAKKAQQPRVF